MEGEEGPLRQELFEDLADFSTPFGEPASADTVSTFLALPEGRNYDAQLPLGLWRDSGSAGALECSYPSRTEWTTGRLVVAGHHPRRGMGSAVLDWLEATAAEHGAVTGRA